MKGWVEQDQLGPVLGYGFGTIGTVQRNAAANPSPLRCQCCRGDGGRGLIRRNELRRRVCTRCRDGKDSIATTEVNDARGVARELGERREQQATTVVKGWATKGRAIRGKLKIQIGIASPSRKTRSRGPARRAGREHSRLTPAEPGLHLVERPCEHVVHRSRHVFDSAASEHAHVRCSPTSNSLRNLVECVEPPRQLNQHDAGPLKQLRVKLVVGEGIGKPETIGVVAQGAFPEQRILVRADPPHVQQCCSPERQRSMPVPDHHELARLELPQLRLRRLQEKDICSIVGLEFRGVKIRSSRELGEERFDRRRVYGTRTAFGCLHPRHTIFI